MKIYQSKEGKFINQAKYYKKLIKIFIMEKEKPISTPMSTSCDVDKDDGGGGSIE